MLLTVQVEEQPPIQSIVNTYPNEAKLKKKEGSISPIIILILLSFQN